jgi:hypothetical protein
MKYRKHFNLLSNVQTNACFTKGNCKLDFFQFCINGTAHFCIFIDYRGRHRKGVKIYNAA